MLALCQHLALPQTPAEQKAGIYLHTMQHIKSTTLVTQDSQTCALSRIMDVSV